MIKCRECEKEISTEARACPNCGAKIKKSSGCLAIALLAIAVPMFLAAINTSEKPHAPPKSKEQIEAETKREAAFQKVVIALKGVKTAMRNQDSIVWEGIGANDDASVICIEYRGQNGFGGISREFAVFLKGKVSQSTDSWNKNCARKNLIDMMYARQAL